MMQFFNSQKKLILKKVFVAENFWSRLVGLMGVRGLSEDQALWIKKCNSVHTFFMKFPIDVIFLNSNNSVVKIIYHMKPWRFHVPVWKASSVLELSSGVACKKQITVGEQLYVES